MKLQRLCAIDQQLQSDRSPMGSSMNAPSRSTLRNPHSRLSTRSLQKSSKKSLLLDKKASLSASKIKQQSKYEQNQAQETLDNIENKHDELLIMSRYCESHDHLKEPSVKDSRKMSFEAEGELKSPNFRSVAQSGGEYGLGQWGMANNSKEISPSETHNQDITISFSKAKNHPNLFQEEAEVRKSCLRQILQYGDEESVAKEKSRLAEDKNNQYLEREIDNILSLKSVYSESYKTPGQSTENTPKKKKGNSTQHLLGKKGSKIKEDASLNQQIAYSAQDHLKIQLDLSEGASPPQEKLTPCFNDYDTPFQKTTTDTETSAGKQGFKLSKKMQELKDKIASRANLSRSKGDLSKYSLQNLSTSFRKVRNSCSLQKSADSRNSSKIQRIKEKLCLTQAQYQNEPLKNAHDKILQSNKSPVPPSKTPLPQGKSPVLSQNKSPIKEVVQQKSMTPKQVSNAKGEARKEQGLKVKEENEIKNRKRKVRESEESKQEKDVKKEIDLNETFSKEQAKGEIKEVMTKLSVRSPERSKEKKLTFTDMVKKQHFSKKGKKTKGDRVEDDQIKFSQVIESSNVTPFEENLFSSTRESHRKRVGQEYDVLDNRENKDYKTQRSRQKQLKARSQQISKLKRIAEELNQKESRLRAKRNSALLQESQNSSSYQQSVRNNRTCHEKSCEGERQPGNMTTINYRDMLASFEEYMLRESVGRPQDSRFRDKYEQKKSRSLEHSKSITSKHKLLIF